MYLREKGERVRAAYLISVVKVAEACQWRGRVEDGYSQNLQVV